MGSLDRTISGHHFKQVFLPQHVVALHVHLLKGTLEAAIIHVTHAAHVEVVTQGEHMSDRAVPRHLDHRRANGELGRRNERPHGDATPVRDGERKGYVPLLVRRRALVRLALRHRRQRQAQAQEAEKAHGHGQPQGHGEDGLPQGATGSRTRAVARDWRISVRDGRLHDYRMVKAGVPIGERHHCWWYGTWAPVRAGPFPPSSHSSQEGTCRWPKTA